MFEEIELKEYSNNLDENLTEIGKQDDIFANIGKEGTHRPPKFWKTLEYLLTLIKSMNSVFQVIKTIFVSIFRRCSGFESPHETNESVSI